MKISELIISKNYVENPKIMFENRSGKTFFLGGNSQDAECPRVETPPSENVPKSKSPKDDWDLGHMLLLNQLFVNCFKSLAE